MPNSGFSYDIGISGLDQLKKELAAIAPDLKNQLTKVFRDAAKEVRDAARTNVPSGPPMSGWRTVKPVKGKSRGGSGWPEWDSARIRNGIEYAAGVTAPGFSSKGSTKFFGYRVYNASAAGNIVEVAGRKSSGRGTGVQFIANLNSRVGATGRLIYDAYDAKAAEIDTRVTREVERIIDEYDKRLNSN
jgi:hypothetical protein